MRALMTVLVPAATLSALAGPELAALDLAEVKARGTLRVLAVSPLPTDEFFSSLPQTDRPGFDRELLEGFASLQRVKLEVVPLTSWDALIPALKEGKGDLIAGRYTVTETRKQQVDFTLEVFPTRNVVVTRAPHRVITTLEELRAERVGTVKGTSLAEAVAAAAVPPDKVDDTVRSGHLPDALKEGKATAVVLGIENAISAQRTDAALQLGLFLGPPKSLAWAVRKADSALLQACNQYIENMRRSPTWSRLVVKYFGEAAPAVLKKARE